MITAESCESQMCQKILKLNCKEKLYIFFTIDFLIDTLNFHT